MCGEKLLFYGGGQFMLGKDTVAVKLAELVCVCDGFRCFFVFKYGALHSEGVMYSAGVDSRPEVVY